MKVKLLAMALVIAGSVFATACDKVGYTCEGAGTCDEPRYCINANTWDSYWEVNGQEFESSDDLYDICGWE